MRAFRSAVTLDGADGLEVVGLIGLDAHAAVMKRLTPCVVSRRKVEWISWAE